MLVDGAWVETGSVHAKMDWRPNAALADQIVASREYKVKRASVGVRILAVMEGVGGVLVAAAIPRAPLPIAFLFLLAVASCAASFLPSARSATLLVTIHSLLIATAITLTLVHFPAAIDRLARHRCDPNTVQSLFAGDVDRCRSNVSERAVGVGSFILLLGLVVAGLALLTVIRFKRRMNQL